MNFYETVSRAVEIYQAQESGKKDLAAASSQANDEAGGEWNVSGIQTAAYKQIFA